MAAFLTREGIVRHLHKIIRQADKELVLVSPYIKVDKLTDSLLEDKVHATETHLVYGKEELKSDEMSRLKSLGIRIYFRNNLHAKCYLNESEALVTSMNLYKFSQENNDEMGILVSRQDEPELYDEIYSQAMIWKSTSTEAEPATTMVDSEADRTRNKPTDGFCIRCRRDIRANPERPYCRECWEEWNKDPLHPEKHCHICGKVNKSATREKPLCRSCYEKYK